jgi:hypothetical protein
MKTNQDVVRSCDIGGRLLANAGKHRGGLKVTRVLVHQALTDELAVYRQDFSAN